MNERRACQRFAMVLKVHYTTYYRRKPEARGTGEAVDMSSSGLRFRTDRLLQQGLKIQVVISWPMPVGEGLQLEFVAWGTIIWTRGDEVGVQIVHHQFMTQPAFTSE